MKLTLRYSKLSILSGQYNCTKSVRIRSYSGPHFPAFGHSLRSVYSCIYTESVDTKAVQIMRFSAKDFFRKCSQILRILWICSHLLKKSLAENFIFCAMHSVYKQEHATIKLSLPSSHLLIQSQQ